MRVGTYEVLDELGRGGMGVVYRVRGRDGNEYALKRLPVESSTDQGRLQRIGRELEALARISHPNVVRARDSGWHGGAFFIVMDLVRGESLGEIIRRQGPFGAAEAAEVCAQLARALHHLHQEGVLHRDVKPDNILLENGRPLLTDLGLARLRDDDQRLTKTGAMMGTPGYCAPELLSSTGSGEGGPTPAVDVYGLGATLYALLTGRAPFEGDSVYDVLVQTQERPPTAPSRALRSSRSGAAASVGRLDEIVLRCLAKVPGDRYVTALDLALDLEAAFYDGGEPGREGVSPALLLAAVIPLLVIVLGGALLLREEAQPEPNTAQTGSRPTAPDPRPTAPDPRPKPPDPRSTAAPSPTAPKPRPTRSPPVPRPTPTPVPLRTGPVSGLEDLGPLGRIAKSAWVGRNQGRWRLGRRGAFVTLAAIARPDTIRYLYLTNNVAKPPPLRASLTVESVRPGPGALGLLYGRPDRKHYYMIGITNDGGRFVRLRTPKGVQDRIKGRAPPGPRSFSVTELPNGGLAVAFDGNRKMTLGRGVLPSARAGLFVIGNAPSAFKDVKIEWRR